jgi:Fe-S cluster assembly protein SufD
MKAMGGIAQNHAKISGFPWLAARRRVAAERLQKTGLPTRRVEGWRFTPVARVAGVEFSPARAELAGDDWSLPAALQPGVEVQSLAAALAAEPASLEPYLGAIAQPHYFAAANAASFVDGLVVRVRAGAAPLQPIRISHTSSSAARPLVRYLRLLVLVEPGARAVLAESYRSAITGEPSQLINAVTEVWLGPEAQLEHVRIAEGSRGGYHLATVAVQQERDSRYTSRVFTLGGALTRLDVEARLEGEGSEGYFDGVYLANSGEHVDHRTVIDHRQPRCRSRERYRGVLDGSGAAVFDGTVLVRRGAQGTAAHQENQNLLLSDHASVNSKPHLEIEADDVTCSHGATVGALDESELFYLRSRGIDAEAAEALLTYAFMRELLEEVSAPELRELLSDRILHRLPQGHTLRDLEDVQ